MTPPIAVQLYSVLDEFAADPAGCLRRLAEIGFGAVEPQDPLTDPRGLRRLIDEAGLDVCATHGPALGERRDEVFEAAGILGTDTVIVPMIAAEEFASRDGVERVAARLNETATAAAAHGLRLGYHNHFWELTLVDGRPALEVLADLLHPDVVLEVDVYWAARGGIADVPALLARMGDRVRYLHVKDGTGQSDGVTTAVGAGSLPIEEILAAAPASVWQVVELEQVDGDRMDVLSASQAYLADIRARAASR